MQITSKDMEKLEARIESMFNRRFEMHEKTEMVIYENMQRLITKHDQMLVGDDGNGGLKNTINEVDKKVSDITTKLKVWSGTLKVLVGGGGLTVLYMVFTSP